MCTHGLQLRNISLHWWQTLIQACQMYQRWSIVITVISFNLSCEQMLLIIIIEEEENSYELIANSFVRHCVHCVMGESTTTRWKSSQIDAIVYVQCDTLQNRWCHIRIPIHSTCHRNDQRWKTSRQNWSIGCLYHWQNHLLYVFIRRIACLIRLSSFYDSFHFYYRLQ